jgi:hypothetical protein
MDMDRVYYRNTHGERYELRGYELNSEQVLCALLVDPKGWQVLVRARVFRRDFEPDGVDTLTPAIAALADARGNGAVDCQCLRCCAEGE